MTRYFGWTVLCASLLCHAGCAGKEAGVGPVGGRGGAPAAYGGDAGQGYGGAGADADGGVTTGDTADAGERQLLQGVAQKGPFIRGTSIVVSELDEALAQTGRSFTSQIDDDSGRFEVSVKALSGRYIKLSATGFYYNEVTGQLSTAPIALVALSDPRGSSSVNVNILTTLETPRVDYLVKHGTAFAKAKKQAQREVLAVFRIELNAASSSEALDVSGKSEADAALLAASALVQGYLSVSELTELLSRIANDLREDGTLEDPKVGALLMNAATLVEPSHVRKHIEQRYEDIEQKVAVGSFEGHMTKFRTDAPYPFVSRTIYPKRGGRGPNLFAMEDGMRVPSVDQADPSTWYSCAAITPPGQLLRIRVTSCVPGSRGSPLSFGELSNWASVGNWLGQELATEDLTVLTPGIISDGRAIVYFDVECPIRIDFYEGGREVKTTKMLTLLPYSP